MASVSVSGTGTASAACQSVSVRVALRRCNASSRVAREEAKRALEDLYTRLRRLAAEGIRFDHEGMAASFALQTVQRGDNTEYEARYDLLVVSEDHDRFAEVFDAITELEGVTAGSPGFQVDASTTQRLRNEAFQTAVERAKARFDFQCGVIGLEKRAFHVASWSYDRRESAPYEGKRLSVSPERALATAGRVTVSITVNLSYERTGLGVGAR